MTRRRALAVALAAVALAFMGTAPAATAAESQAPGCDIRDATLSWGFKESFRAYIDGDIANGEWTTAGGATYETPVFTWSGGTGRYDPATGSGSVQFTGSVRFTGHDGLLDTTIADPAVSITDEGGMLILDVSGPSMEGEQIDAKDVEFVELFDLTSTSYGMQILLDASSVLTHDGEAAFPDYQAGISFDPVELDLALDQCSPPYSGGDDIPPSPPGFASVGFIALPVLLVAAAIVGVVFVLRRRNRA